jgi:hypothetical protein
MATKEGCEMIRFRISKTLPILLVLIFGGVTLARAQSVDVFFGLGSATDKSTGQQFNTFGDGNLYATPSMGGVFGSFGGDAMIRPGFGIGAEYSARFTQGGYAGLNYRPKFYDFNAIWTPYKLTKKVEPEFQAGIGGATLAFYYPQQCNQFACSSSSYLESSSHFATHFSAGVRFYVKGDIFIRPQIDVRYVNNFYQFGSNWVPQYSIAIGYTLGRR